MIRKLRRHRKCRKIRKKKTGNRTLVKIPNTGPLVVGIRSGRNMIKVFLNSGQFWIEQRLLEETRQEMEK